MTFLAGQVVEVFEEKPPMEGPYSKRARRRDGQQESSALEQPHLVFTTPEPCSTAGYPPN